MTDDVTFPADHSISVEAWHDGWETCLLTAEGGTAYEHDACGVIATILKWLKEGRTVTLADARTLDVGYIDVSTVWQNFCKLASIIPANYEKYRADMLQAERDAEEARLRGLYGSSYRPYE